MHAVSSIVFSSWSLCAPNTAHKGHKRVKSRRQMIYVYLLWVGQMNFLSFCCEILLFWLIKDESFPTKSDESIEPLFLLLDIDVFDWMVFPFWDVLVGVCNYVIDEGFFIVLSFNCFIRAIFLGKYSRSGSVMLSWLPQIVHTIILFSFLKRDFRQFVHMEWSQEGTSLGKLVYSKRPAQWQHLWFREEDMC